MSEPHIHIQQAGPNDSGRIDWLHFDAVRCATCLAEKGLGLTGATFRNSRMDFVREKLAERQHPGCGGSIEWRQIA